MNRLRQWLHELAFGMLLRLCEKTEQSTGATGDGTGDLMTAGWSSSSVPSISGKSVYPFLILVLTVRRRGKVYMTLSPAQAMSLCANGEQMIKDQMLKFGHTRPLDWDTNGSKFQFVEFEKE